MKKLLISLGCCLAFSACTDYQANKYYEAAQQQEQRYEWEAAERTYSELLNKFPKSKIAAQAKLAMEECIKEKTDYQANKYYETAQQQEQQYDWATAERTYFELLNKFPQSKIATQAKLSMEECNKKKEEIESLSRECDELISKKDYEAAVNKLEGLLKLDMAGEKKEQIQGVLDSTKLQLADVYYAKKGNKNKQKAFALFKEAAEKGNASAQYSIGFMLQNGQGTKTNHKEAEGWYRKAAEQGEERAIKELNRIEKERIQLQKLERKTADRKSYKFYNFLGEDISDILRSVGGNYNSTWENEIYGSEYVCYRIDGSYSEDGVGSEFLSFCHKKGKERVSGVIYQYFHNANRLRHLPKVKYHIPKSFLNLPYTHDFDKYGQRIRIYSVKDEKWGFCVIDNMWKRGFVGDDAEDRICGVSIFLL